MMLTYQSLKAPNWLTKNRHSIVNIKTPVGVLISTTFRVVLLLNWLLCKISVLSDLYPLKIDYNFLKLFQIPFQQTCGNKKVERGEECDCGTLEVGLRIQEAFFFIINVVSFFDHFNVLIFFQLVFECFLEDWCHHIFSRFHKTCVRVPD